MSFRCGLCKINSEPGEKAIRVVTETRLVTYPVRLRAHRISRHEYKDDPGGQGEQIAKEVLAHAPCALKRTLK